MRSVGVGLFEYQPARVPKAFISNKPDKTSPQLCEPGADLVVFKQQGEAELYAYPLELLLLDGQLSRSD
jgi:hypothetical protein